MHCSCVPVLPSIAQDLLSKASSHNPVIYEQLEMDLRKWPIICGLDAYLHWLCINTWLDASDPLFLKCQNLWQGNVAGLWNSLLIISVWSQFTVTEASLHNIACEKLQEAPYAFKILFLSVLLKLEFERDWSGITMGLSLMAKGNTVLRKQ